MKPANQYILLRLSFLPALIALGLLLAGVPSFIRMYQSFGVELPAATTLLFTWYPLLGLLPFLFLLAWFRWPNQTAPGTAAFLISITLSAAVLLFSVWAAYMPTFKL